MGFDVKRIYRKDSKEYLVRLEVELGKFFKKVNNNLVKYCGIRE